MSEHSHDHASHDHSHGGHDHGGHAAHGHDERKWGDYNNEAVPPSNLPPVSTLALAVFGLALIAMLGAITFYSLRLSTAKSASAPEAPAAAHAEPSKEPAHDAKPEHH